MKKLISRGLSVALLLAAAGGVNEIAAQTGGTTFTACRVPDVGAIYMIGVEGAPSECLDATHVQFSWTEGSGSLTEGSVTTTEILDGTIASVDIGADAVTSAEIADGSVATSDIAADAVTSAEIADGSVATADIANAAVTSSEIATGAVGAAEIATGAVGSAEIASGAVRSEALADGLFQWAGVRGTDGAVFSGSGGITGSRLSTGVYQLDFAIAVSSCAILATPGDGAHMIRQIHGSRYGGGPNQLRINLYDASGSPVDGGFGMMVICT